jgi:hypothetical protein
MKLNFEKIFFYFMLIVVSGSIGYALKPTENLDQRALEEKYSNQQRVCAQAMHTMSTFSRQNFNLNKKTEKEKAIERMMSR